MCPGRLTSPISCGVSSVVERYPSKLDVVGSNPILRLPFYKYFYDPEIVYERLEVCQNY